MPTPSPPSLLDTDLAAERHRILSYTEGVCVRTAKTGCVTKEEAEIQSPTASERLGRPVGRYVTLSFPSPTLLLPDDEDCICRAVSETLCALFSSPPSRLLVVGLGNRRLTADAIGPQTAEHVLPSASLAALDKKIPLRCLCARFIPDVMAETGLESALLVKGAVRAFGADAVLTVDALAASSSERLYRTVELCDSGTVPGSGVGNRRRAISRDTLGIPTLSLGVPTVMRGSTFLRNAAPDLAEEEIRRAAQSLYLMPSGAEESLSFLSRLLADAITQATNALIPHKNK